MAVFHMKIAGYTGKVTSLFESTRDYCKDYLTRDEADFSVTVTGQDLAAEQAFLYEEARQEGLKARRFTDPFLERAVIQRRFAQFLFSRDILLLHGSAIAAHGEGILFTAKCGTGKSTHARLWMELLGENAVTVNDDKPFLQIRKEDALLWGAPWSGKHGLSSNICVPLKGICLLERGAENRIVKADGSALLPVLKTQTFDTGQDPAPLLRRLAQFADFWQLTCTKDPSAAQTAYAAIFHRV